MEIPDQSLSKDDPSAQPCWQQPGKESHPREGTLRADAADSSTLAESSTLSPISSYTYQNSANFSRKSIASLPNSQFLAQDTLLKNIFHVFWILPFETEQNSNFHRVPSWNQPISCNSPSGLMWGTNCFLDHGFILWFIPELWFLKRFKKIQCLNWYLC